MKQSDDPKLFFDKYQFTMTIEKPCPISKDKMIFTGLEARYVQSLESKINDFESYTESLRKQLRFWETRDYREFAEKLEKAEKDHK